MVRTRSPLDQLPVVRFTATDLYIGTRHEAIFRLAWIASPTVVPPRGGTFDFVEPISDLPCKVERGLGGGAGQSGAAGQNHSTDAFEPRRTGASSRRLRHHLPQVADP